MSNLTKVFESLLVVKDNPFPWFEKMVGEQLVMLAMVARHLYLDNKHEHKKWFNSYSQIVDCLSKDHVDLINKTRADRANFRYTDLAPFEAGVFALKRFFSDADDNTLFLDTCASMKTELTTEQNYNRDRNKVSAKEELYPLISDMISKGLPAPISFAKRLGYRHQNLLVSLKNLHQISEFLKTLRELPVNDILQNGIYDFLKDHAEHPCLPNKARRLTTKLNWVGKGQASEQDCERIAEYLKTDILEFKKETVNEKLLEQLCLSVERAYAYFLGETLDKYLSDLLDDFNSDVYFDWRFCTPSLNEDNSEELYPKRKPCCEISIDYEQMIELFKKDHIEHASLVLVQCLRDTYYEIDALKGGVKSFIGKEEEHSTAKMSKGMNIKKADYLNYFNRLSSWYAKNRVLFKCDRKPMKVEAMLNALACFDMKEGIYQDKMTLKEAAHRVANRCDVSEITIKRNYSKIKKVIHGDIQSLVEAQKLLNEAFSISEGSNVIKPLWDSTSR